MRLWLITASSRSWVAGLSSARRLLHGQTAGGIIFSAQLVSAIPVLRHIFTGVPRLQHGIRHDRMIQVHWSRRCIPSGPPRGGSPVAAAPASTKRLFQAQAESMLVRSPPRKPRSRSPSISSPSSVAGDADRGNHNVGILLPRQWLQGEGASFTFVQDRLGRCGHDQSIVLQ